jgi:hypothetical protein
MKENYVVRIFHEAYIIWSDILMTLNPILSPLQTALITARVMFPCRRSFDPNNIAHHFNVKKPRVN